MAKRSNRIAWLWVIAPVVPASLLWYLVSVGLSQTEIPEPIRLAISIAVGIATGLVIEWTLRRAKSHEEDDSLATPPTP